jgi:hypothetical protein
MEDVGWKPEDFTIGANQACSDQTDELSGTSGADCSHHGTATLIPTSTGISGTATFTVNCPQLGASNCTANYDLTWILQ